jgi:hypothetical protein
VFNRNVGYLLDLRPAAERGGPLSEHDAEVAAAIAAGAPGGVSRGSRPAPPISSTAHRSGRVPGSVPAVIEGEAREVVPTADDRSCCRIFSRSSGRRRAWPAVVADARAARRPLIVRSGIARAGALFDNLAVASFASVAHGSASGLHTATSGQQLECSLDDDTAVKPSALETYLDASDPDAPDGQSDGIKMAGPG